MHLLISRMGEHNAVVASRKNLARLMGCHPNTVDKAIDDLVRRHWIEVRQTGGTGSTNAYIINDRVAWSGKREGIRYSLFSASVLVSDDDQPDVLELDKQQALHRIPRMFPDERQLPSGEGLPPPSEPPLPGMEPDLPALRERARGGEPTPIGELIAASARVSGNSEPTDI
jgi:DNA-binding transcriptional MocR family regulator